MEKSFTIVFIALAFTVEGATNVNPPAVVQTRVNSPSQAGPSIRFDATNSFSSSTGRGAEAAWETYTEPGAFVMSLARDGSGNVWVGTEGNGVWRFNPNVRSNQWTQFQAKKLVVEEVGNRKSEIGNADGLGDDHAYSVAVDKQGRIWAGHLNHGVSVYNGSTWKNYEVPHGPIGERVFKIAVCPVDGDVWIGTSAGLTRYSVVKDSWEHFTRVNGLPAEQITAITFDKQGNIFVGTQCDGVAMASREADYRDWKQAKQAEQGIPTFAGFGLPSKLINDLLVASDGTIYAATCGGGLAWSRDSGTTWQFRRGKDYADKMKGKFGGPPKGWSGNNIPKDIPPEDYVTCLAEDNCGVIWADFRQHGMLALSGYSYEELDKMSAQETGGADYGRAILPMPDHRPWLASYGKGLLRSTEARQLRKRSIYLGETAALATNAPFPSLAKPPTLTELTTMVEVVERLRSEKAIPVWPEVTAKEAVKKWSPPKELPSGYTNAAYLGEDWRTLGDWMGRYGRQQAILCSAASPMDHNVGWGWRTPIDPSMGPHHSMGDSLRHWITSDRVNTGDPRCPYTPVKGFRRIGEWDDHGEAYPMSFDGPDIWIAVGLPDGVFRVSVYFCDYNGHDGPNRFRDYLMELKPYVAKPEDWDKQTTLAKCRVHDFFGGVYKSFVVTGPGKYHIKIGRNNSFNTMCNAVFVDRVVGPGWKGCDDSWLPGMEHTWYEPPDVPLPDFSKESPELLKARELWKTLDAAYAVKDGVAMQGPLRLAAYQTALANNAPYDLLYNWRWAIPFWTTSDRKEFWEVVQRAYRVRTAIVETNGAFGMPKPPKPRHAEDGTLLQ